MLSTNDLEQINRELQLTASGQLKKGPINSINQQVTAVRAEARKNGTRLTRAEAKQQIEDQEKNSAKFTSEIDKALKAAMPKFASDPNGLLGKPVSVPVVPSPAPLPVDPLPSKQTIPPSGDVSFNLGDDDVEEGETKARVLREAQSIAARRLYCLDNSGLTVEESEDEKYINISIIAPPDSGRYVLGSSDGVISWTPLESSGLGVGMSLL